MVSVVHSVAAQSDPEVSIATLSEGLSAEECVRLRAAADFARVCYGDEALGTGEGVWPHALGMALIVAGLRLDVDSRCAALLFAVPGLLAKGDEAVAQEQIEAHFGRSVAQLVAGVTRLNRLRPIARGFLSDPGEDPQEAKAQIEVLRKMLLAMVEDIRVVLLRLASRTQTLRYYAAHPAELRATVARETLELYSPLANRLGVWELKWELEDLSFRFLHPDLYKKIAVQLDEKRIEREQFITDAIARLRTELATVGVADAEIYGRPKHIYSIWNKMRKKCVEFSEVYDVRALRVIVDEVKDCYTVLGIVHNLWTPIPKEFDDYISNPKGNYYRSLHTAVRCPDGRSLEVQVRTRDMHRHAELGVAAHWRYKEGSKAPNAEDYDEKIALLRQLLQWKDEVADSADWVRRYKQAELDETIYVLTPQGRVVPLPRGATPLDFAYRVHTDLGHRCRGARVNGALVTLNTQLENGQRVEIISAKQGGPSRDWLNPAQGYLTTPRARAKARQWFASLAQEESLAEGRTLVMRELQRIGMANANLDEVAGRLGLAGSDEMLVAFARGEVGPRALQVAARGEAPVEATPELASPIRKPKAKDGDSGILIVGVDKLLTQLAGCCKPAPPDAIVGFVTRGKGVSIHRADCSNVANMSARHPERLIETAWGNASKGSGSGVFAVDVVVEANDRQGLLRDVSEVFSREKINVTAVNTLSRAGMARMGFTVEIGDITHLKRTLGLIREVSGVVGARRA
ncbi:RelA/SpoT family protein [Rhodocyclus tenuis]|uniref:GTP pyrophosphokinase n=1 Tax=Rhodocyclus tenuis TaxID=1066 RepID=A0A840GLC1_RHOTE|nr:bifunctional (p)ppGpp synthetase/guanosine-3',5'-bis(diphosphate) 3'-pyrophosphohydrolase [Rhodocyclus tenuis]MBB4248959.1 GTP pyrophosphokinase [Rhodocyclus tenuis]